MKVLATLLHLSILWIPIHSRSLLRFEAEVGPDPNVSPETISSPPFESRPYCQAATSACKTQCQCNVKGGLQCSTDQLSRLCASHQDNNGNVRGCTCPQYSRDDDLELEISQMTLNDFTSKNNRRESPTCMESLALFACRRCCVCAGDRLECSRDGSCGSESDLCKDFFEEGTCFCDNKELDETKWPERGGKHPKYRPGQGERDGRGRKGHRKDDQNNGWGSGRDGKESGYESCDREDEGRRSGDDGKRRKSRPNKGKDGRQEEYEGKLPGKRPNNGQGDENNGNDQRRPGDRLGSGDDNNNDNNDNNDERRPTQPSTSMSDIFCSNRREMDLVRDRCQSCCGCDSENRRPYCVKDGNCANRYGTCTAAINRAGCSCPVRSNEQRVTTVQVVAATGSATRPDEQRVMRVEM